jgi:transcription antitermination factor NusG
MAMKWYVVHTYSGHENKAKLSLLDRVRQAGLNEKFGDILIPTDTVVELVKGQKRSTTRKFFPGYMFVQMDLDQETFHLVKNTPKITGLPRRHESAAGQGDGDPEHQHGDDRGGLAAPSRASPTRRATACG